MLEFTNVTKEYGSPPKQVRALDDISFRLTKGQHIGILGGAGSGRSTLLKLAAGFERPSAGKIRRDMTVSWPLGSAQSVLQNQLTGYGNLRFIAAIYKKPFEEISTFVEEFSESTSALYEPAQSFSRSVRQRVSFALSLAIDFDCYLIDEFITTGDKSYRQKCRELFKTKTRNKAVVMTSSRPDDLLEFCEEGILLNGGRILERFNMLEKSGWRARYRETKQSQN